MRWIRRLPVLPLLLGLVSILGAVGVVAVEAGAGASGSVMGGPRLVTPVLSARRVPTLVAAPVAARRLRHDLDAWAEDPPGQICLVVEDEDGEEAYSRAGEVPMVPASTLKLFTATAALEGLGDEHRFRTSVVGPAPVDGVVVGDVFLVGGGDPLLSTADYAARFSRQPQTFTDVGLLVAGLAQAGVTRIEGSVRGDESRYDSKRYVDGWPARYLAQHVIGPLSALALNDGYAEYPSADRWRPLVPAPDPPVHAAAVLTILLEARGIEVVGPPAAGTAPADLTELAAVESPPLVEVLRQLLLESDNSTAELLLKEMGRTAGDPSTAGGLAAARAALDEEAFGPYTLADGSGLSLDDRVTCQALVDALQRPGTGPRLQDLLPVAGLTGTLQKAFLDTDLVGHVAAKTGSLNSVAGLAGAVEDADGTLTFAYLVNVPVGQRVDEGAVAASQARLGQILLDHPRTPDLEVLGPMPVPRP